MIVLVRGVSVLFPPEVRAATVLVACHKPDTDLVLVPATVEPECHTAAPESTLDPIEQPSVSLADQNRSPSPFVETDPVTGGTVIKAPVSRFSTPVIAWILTKVGLVTSISARTIARWLRSAKLKPWRFRSWITPKDLTKFLPRACDVLDLYERVARGLRRGEAVFSVDEKTSIQARQRATYKPTGGGDPAHIEHTYARRGAVHLFAALNVGVGKVFGKLYPHKTFQAFADFLTDLIGQAAEQGNHSIHLILDNGSTHRPKYLETWLKEHFPRLEVVVHWLPVRSSWLNQIEIFFGILQAHVLAPNNFPSPQAVMERILRYIHFYNLDAKSIEWIYTSNDLRRKYNVVEMTPSEESSTGTREMGKVA
ncbi:MAG: IS630 family transposase [Armatimonadetes bacterium]|nr:IS630 family transposase [Armatimonadota bacterium]